MEGFIGMKRKGESNDIVIILNFFKNYQKEIGIGKSMIKHREYEQ